MAHLNLSKTDAKKIKALIKAATEVNRRGAEVGSQWMSLTAALLSINYLEGRIDKAAAQKEMDLDFNSKGRAVTNKMVKAAQDSYSEHSNPSYGLTNADMKVALQAAIKEMLG